MDENNAKIFAMVSLGLGTVIIGLSPALFARHGRGRWPLLLSCLLCFGGGVLFSTSVVHILPELRETFPSEYKQYAELCFCVGFFILYLMDEVVHVFFGETHVETDVLERCRTPSTHKYGATECTNLIEKNPPYNPAFYRARSDSVLLREDAPSQLCHVGHQEPCTSAAPTANLGLLTALSVHSLLEGLIVGLETSSTKVLLLLGAIASHKLVVGFCLGVELASNASTSFCRHFTGIFIFAVGSVGGIISGMLVSDIPSTLSRLVIPISQGLAGGTLLYVTVSEVLPRERARWHQLHDKKWAGAAQFFSVVLGFGLMSVITKFLDKD